MTNFNLNDIFDTLFIRGLPNKSYAHLRVMRQGQVLLAQFPIFENHLQRMLFEDEGKTKEELALRASALCAELRV
jgi:hypothetical protein